MRLRKFRKSPPQDKSNPRATEARFCPSEVLTHQGEEEDMLRMSADVGKEPKGSLQMTERMSDVGRNPREEGGSEGKHAHLPSRKE